MAAPTSTPALDTDADGLSDEVELQLGTNLNNADTDADGYPDGQEVFSGYNPWVGNKDRHVRRRVEVNLTTQQMTLFLNDVRIAAMPVSSGLIRTPTPTGEFAIQRKVPVIRYRGADYDFPGTKWNLQFKKHYYLHGAYWHNQFGKRPMSHGCVNIAYKNAEKLYAFLQVGDKVKIIGKTPLGLVKNTVAKN